MKNVKRLFSAFMSVIMVLSILTVVGISATASDYSGKTEKGQFILATGNETAKAARFALGETVYGKITSGETLFYYLFNDTTRTISFSFKTDSEISVKVYSATNTPYISDTGITTTFSKDSADMPAGGYYIEVIGGGTTGTTAHFNFSTKCASMTPLAMKINHPTISLVSGNTVQLQLSEISVANINYFWTVFDDPVTSVNEADVVSVTKEGLVTVNDSEGLFNVDTPVKVYAFMYYNGLEQVKTCTVTAVPGNIFLNPYYDTSAAGSIKLGVGSTKTVTATTNLAGKSVVWSSDNEAVAIVDAYGKITGVSAGTATVSVAVSGKKLHRDIKVIIDPNLFGVAGVSLSAHTASVRAGENITLTKTFTTTPANHAPTNDKVTYSSDNTKVATVDQNGKVTGVSVGTAKITVKTDDGGYTDSCTVTVNEALPNWLMLIIAPIRLIYNFILLILGK